MGFFSEYIASQLGDANVAKAYEAVINDKPEDLKKMIPVLNAFNKTASVVEFSKGLKKYTDVKYALPTEQLLPLDMLKESEDNFSKYYTNLPVNKRKEAAKNLYKAGSRNTVVLAYSNPKDLMIKKSCIETLENEFWNRLDVNDRKMCYGLAKVASVVKDHGMALRLAHMIEHFVQDPINTVFVKKAAEKVEEAKKDITLGDKKIELKKITKQIAEKAFGDKDFANSLFDGEEVNYIKLNALPKPDKELLGDYVESSI